MHKKIDSVLIVSTLAKIAFDNFDNLNSDELMVLQAFKRANPKFENSNLDEISDYLQGLNDEQLTGLSNIYLEQVGAFGDPDRINKEADREWLKSIRAQPEARVITVAYYSLVKMEDYSLQASSFAKEAACTASSFSFLATAADGCWRRRRRCRRCFAGTRRSVKASARSGAGGG